MRHRPHPEVITCTPVASDITGYSGPGDGRNLRIKQMVDSGLSAVNS
jgi:hypothetical protein